MTFKNLRRALGAAAATLLLTATQASAASMWCTVEITRIGQNAGGLLMVDTSIGTFYMCSLTDPANTGGVSTEVCKAWMAAFISSKATGNTVDMLFNFPGAAPSCSWGVVGHWARPNPFPDYLGFR